MLEDDFRKVDEHVETHASEWVAELSELCAQPSVSAQGQGMHECAELLGGMLRKRGFQVQVMPTGGYPAVYAEAPGRSNRTLLFYNHYDVQPPEPLELWDSPPFEPTQRHGALYARGAADDKGHILCRLAAVDAVKAAGGGLPCRIKFLIEGEEEIGSPSLPELLARHRDLFATDAVIWEAGGVGDEGKPRQYAGMRGIFYVDLKVRTASLDAHSGLGGSLFPNAAWRLTWALNALKGPDERVRIPGFYDDVRPPSARDLELLAALPDISGPYRRLYGLKGFVKGTTDELELKRDAVFVPTCTICGLNSGYQGPGTKTVLPAEAAAKVDFRLVPDQRPERVLAQLRAHLDAQGFGDVEVATGSNTPPGRTDPDHPFLRLVSRAALEVYGCESLIAPLVGASGPYFWFLEHLRAPIGTTGVSHPGNRGHAPNEHVRLDLFAQGVRHTARVIEQFARQGP